MHGLRPRLGVLALFAALLAITACGEDSTGPGSDPGRCLDPVEAFPVSVGSSSPFSDVDDGFVEVPFHPSFRFAFYGAQYDRVYLNTNGGMTFGEEYWYWNVQAVHVTAPGIAVFWGDMDAGEFGGATRNNQLVYQSCADVFVIKYLRLQDNDEAAWTNTAILTLSPAGVVTIAYGSVLSEDIMVGVFDGTHTDDRYPELADDYPDYATTGTGTILFDKWGLGPAHAGELSGRTITFTP